MKCYGWRMEPNTETEPIAQRKTGRPLKTDEKLKTYSFSLSPSQIDRLDGWAAAKGESRSGILRSLVMRLEEAPVVEPKPLKVADTPAAPVAPIAPVVSSEQADRDIALATDDFDALDEVVPAAEPAAAEPTVADRIAAALASLDA